ncbi:MAG: chorismate-binding protein, partial [Bacilli bacterium]
MSIDIGTHAPLCDQTYVDAFSDALRDSREQARLRGEAVVACCALPLAEAACDLRTLFAAAKAYDARWYWSDPGARRRWCALGATMVRECEGLQPVSEAAQALADLNRRVLCFGAAAARWLAGFAFDAEQPRDERWREWPNGLLMLPRFVVEQHSELPVVVTVCVQVEAHTDTERQCDDLIAELVRALDGAQTDRAGTITTGTDRADTDRTDTDMAAAGGTGTDGARCRDAGDGQRLFAAPGYETTRSSDSPKLPGLRDLPDLPPEMAAWTEAILSIEGDLRKGFYEKVVMARRERVPVQSFARLPQVLHDLETRYGDGVVFAVARGFQVFAGATPERLVQARQGDVSIDCLAGTAPRGDSRSEDETMAATLLASRKNREEHALVLRGIVGDIKGIVEAVYVPDAPVIRRLANVQHLYTPVRGRLAATKSIID